MSRYSPMALPPQEPSTVWSCADCGAIVVDRQAHDSTGHGEWNATVPNPQLPAPTVKPRRYAP